MAGPISPLREPSPLVFKTNYCLMQVKSIAECSKGSILQYFCPSFSYHLSLSSLFCVFLSGCFTQVLLYELTNLSIYENTFISVACNGSIFKKYP